KKRLNNNEKNFFGLKKRKNIEEENEKQQLENKINGEPQHILFELDAFDALDLKNGFDSRSTETQEYIDERLRQLETKVNKEIHNRKQKLEFRPTKEQLEQLFAY